MEASEWDNLQRQDYLNWLSSQGISEQEHTLQVITDVFNNPTSRIVHLEILKTNFELGTGDHADN